VGKIIKYFVNWLKVPYFSTNSLNVNLLLAFAAGIFTFIIFYILKPFGIDKYHLNNYFLYSAGFGIITIICIIFFIQIIPYYFFQKLGLRKKWTILKEIIFELLLVSAMAILFYIYSFYVQETDSIPLISLSKFFKITFSVAFFTYLFLVYVLKKIEKIILIKKTAKKITLTSFTKKEKGVIFYSSNKKESISIELDQLVYINSEANYVSFFLLKEGKVKEVILRSTLKNVMNELNDYHFVVRCHKSFIVNMQHIISYSGNTKGYFLNSELLKNPIPVSRNFTKKDLDDLINLPSFLSQKS
jgi:DNA-binding LytR/AlgR family response regulator